MLLNALDELSGSQTDVNVKRIVDGPSDFAIGMTGVGQYVMLAGVFLVEAMLRKYKFEQKLIGCLIMLSAINKSLVDEIGQTVLSALELQNVDCLRSKNVG